VDPNTRTTPSASSRANPGGLLKKDMFVRRRDSHQHCEQHRWWFRSRLYCAMTRTNRSYNVQAEPGKFAQRSVVIGAQQNGLVAITSGLQG